MVDVKIVTPTWDDAVEMSRRVHAAHLDSIIRVGDGDVEDCVMRSYCLATHRWAASVDGRIEAMWGVYPVSVLTGIGYPWLFGSQKMKNCTRVTYVVAKRAIKDMIAAYPRLFGVVDSDFDASVRFARRIGFTIRDGIIDGRFLSIEMRA